MSLSGCNVGNVGGNNTETIPIDSNNSPRKSSEKDLSLSGTYDSVYWSNLII